MRTNIGNWWFLQTEQQIRAMKEMYRMNSFIGDAVLYQFAPSMSDRSIATSHASRRRANERTDLGITVAIQY